MNIRNKTEAVSRHSTRGERSRTTLVTRHFPDDTRYFPLTVIYGDVLAREIGFYSLAGRLLDGERIVVLDAANEFNAFIFSDVARRAGVPVRELLSRLLVSRTFTCHQLATLIVERTRPTLYQYNARTLVVLDLLTTFYDQEVPRWEAERLLRRPLQCLRWLANHGYQVLLLCSHEPHVNRERRAFFEQLKVLSDRVLRVTTSGECQVTSAENGLNGHKGVLMDRDPRSAPTWTNGRGQSIAPVQSAFSRHSTLDARHSPIAIVSEKPWTGERWELDFESTFTRRRKHQPPMKWMNT